LKMTQTTKQTLRAQAVTCFLESAFETDIHQTTPIDYCHKGTTTNCCS
jgi:hypothetical protein